MHSHGLSGRDSRQNRRENRKLITLYKRPKHDGDNRLSTTLEL